MQREDRAKPVTIISPVHRWWALWLLATWPPADRSQRIKRPLVELGFIHIAHWSLARWVPAKRRWRKQRSRLPHPYVIFQSNFNDDLVAYIDAFSLVVPGQIRGAWQGVFHFPGPQPVDRFVKFISDRIIPTDDCYYYCAYPEASSTTIRAALELDERCDRFTSETRMLDARAFRSRFDEFLGEVAPLLEETEAPR